jgi:hypothetical protein
MESLKASEINHNARMMGLASILLMSLCLVSMHFVAKERVRFGIIVKVKPPP